LTAAGATGNAADRTEDGLKPYEQLAGIEKAAEVAYAAWEAEMVTFSKAFLKTLVDELGWPEDGFTRLQGEVPMGGRLAPGGYADAAGYHFAVRFGLGRSWLQVVFAVSRGAEGHDVKIGTETFRVVLEDPATLAPIVEDIVAEMTKTLLLREAAAQTGYVP
jgi:hypothetical protein